MKITRTPHEDIITFQDNRADNTYNYCAEHRTSDGDFIFAYGPTPHQAKLNLQEEYRNRYTGEPQWLTFQHIREYNLRYAQRYQELTGHTIHPLHDLAPEELQEALNRLQP